MSNYSLQEVSTRIDDIQNNPEKATSQEITNVLSLEDGQGTNRAIQESEAGIIHVRFGDSGVDIDEGPNDRAISSSAVDTSANTITIANHGFQTNDIVRLKLPISGGGEIPGGVVSGQDYYAHVVDSSTIKLKTSTSASSFLNLTSQGSGIFLVCRNIFVAFDMYEHSTVSPGSYVLAVNFRWKYGTQAYRWLAKYTNIRRVAFLCGLGTDSTQFFYWNKDSADPPGPSAGGGPEWEAFDEVSFYGKLVPRANTFSTSLGRAQGTQTISANGKTYPASGVGMSHDNTEEVANPGWGNWRNYVFMPHDRARMIVISNPNRGIVWWFRYPQKVYFYNIWLDFQLAADQYIAALIRTGPQVLTMINVAMYTWSADSTGDSGRGSPLGPYVMLELTRQTDCNILGNLLMAYGRSGEDPGFIGVANGAKCTLDPLNQTINVSLWKPGSAVTNYWEVAWTMTGRRCMVFNYYHYYLRHGSGTFAASSGAIGTTDQAANNVVRYTT